MVGACAFTKKLIYTERNICMFTTIDNQQNRITEFYELLYNGADLTQEKFKIAILNNG